MRKIKERTLNTLYSSCYITYGAYIIFELNIILLVPIFFVLDYCFIHYMYKTRKMYKFRKKYTESNKINLKLASLSLSTLLCFLFICLIMYHFIDFFNN